MAAAVRPQASLDRKKKRESAGPAKLNEEGDRPRGTALLEEGLPRSRPELPEPLVQVLALRAALGSSSMVAKKHAGQQRPEEPSLEPRPESETSHQKPAQRYHEFPPPPRRLPLSLFGPSTLSRKGHFRTV